MGIRDQALRGGFYLTVRQAIGLVIRLGGVLLLTRLIGPASYGLYVTGYAVVTLAASVTWFGIDTYLVREEGDVPRETMHQAFWLLVLHTAIVLLLGLAALGAVALLMEDQRYLAPTLVMLLLLPIKVLWTPAQAILERGFQYRRLATLELGSDVMYYAVALPLAFAGFGVWAPVAGFGAWQGTLLAGSFLLSGYRPRWFWSPPVARSMLRYGSTFSIGVWVAKLGDMVNPVVVGAFIGPAAVGQVALAMRVIEAFGFVRKPARRIALVALGRVQSDIGKVRYALEDGMTLQTLALAPGLIGFAVLGPWAVDFALGDEWQEMIRVFPYLAAATLAMAAFDLPKAFLNVRARNLVVAASESVRVAILALGSLLLVPLLAVVGFGVAKLLTIASFIVVHIALSQMVQLRYRRVAPWLLALAPPLFTPLVPLAVVPVLWLPAAVLLATRPGRQRLVDLATAVRAALRSGRGVEPAPAEPEGPA